MGTMAPTRARVLSAVEAGIASRLIAPDRVETGRATSVGFALAEAASGAPVNDVVESHEAWMHLIAVRRDLTQFQHVHPVPTGAPGQFAVETRFDASGDYLVFGEIVRRNGTAVLVRDAIKVDGVASPEIALAADTRAKTVDGTRVSLIGASHLHVGAPSQLLFHLADAATGAPITTLGRYLGEPAHVVFITPAGSSFVHAHGEPLNAGAAHVGGGSTVSFGPDIVVEHTFGTTGLHKLWAQFQSANGRVITAEFVVHVE
jgi:Cu+-exporting ATPase